MITVQINNIPVEVPEGTTILHAAKQAGIRIPTLCHVEGLQTIGACRVCVVEVANAATWPRRVPCRSPKG